MPDNVTNVDMAAAVKSGETTAVAVTYDSATDSAIAITCDPGFSVDPTSRPAPAASGGLAQFLLRVSRSGADPETVPECVVSFTLPGTEDFEKRVTVT